MVRIGIIGLGRAACAILPAMVAHPDVEIVAAADPQADVLAAFCEDFAARGYGDGSELVDDPDVDVVYIATPHHLHREQAVLAAKAGKGILVEKPMALTLEDCDEMIDAAASAGVLLMVGHTHGFDAPVLAMRELTREQRFGPLRMISALNFTDFLYRPRRPEELDTSLGGGIIFDQLPHQVDCVRAIADSAAVRISATCGVWDECRPTEGALAALLHFADGVVASLIYSGYAHLDARSLYEGLDAATGRPSTRSARAAIAGLTPEEEAEAKARTGYLARREALRVLPQPASRHNRYGLIVASYEDADVVPSATGLVCYSNSGIEEIPVSLGTGSQIHSPVLDELSAAFGGAQLLHDGAWGRATMEICLVALESSRRDAEVLLG